MNNVYIECSNGEYKRMFEKAGWSVVNELAKADIICFTGGSDVSPNLYGEHTHPYSSTDSHRDFKESGIFSYGVDHSVPMVGICRGGQFLNVMNGGKMYQHVEGHCANHYMQDQVTKECILVSSTHHQMIRPTADAVVVASTDVCVKSKQFMSAVVKPPGILFSYEKEPDIEVVFYPATKSLCFQPHPEFCSREYERMTAYFFELLNRYILKD